MKKKILSVICVLALCLGLLPAGTLAVDSHVSLSALEYKIEAGKTVTITDCAEGARGDLVIPDTIEGCSVTKIDQRAFLECKQITSIKIPETVTNIGIWAFSHCESLAEIVIPDSVTMMGHGICNGCENLQLAVVGKGLKSLPSSTFAHCPKLNDVRLSDSITEIGDWAFEECESLTSINLPNSLKTVRKDAFEGSGLTSIKIPDSVEYLGDYAFGNCYNLKSVRLGSGLKRMEKDVFKSTALESVVIPDNVKSMGRSDFYDCNKLKTVTIGGVETVPDGTFVGCESLETMILREGVKRIEKCFTKGDDGLKSLYLPSSLVEIETGCFEYSTNIRDIYYNGTPYSWGGVAIGLKNDPILSDQVTMHYIPFSDTQPGEYYYDPMVWAIDEGITNGTSKTTFSPYDTCTQGHILTFLYRAAGKPAVSGGNNFTNEIITPGKYYYNAMLWAAEQGIVTNMGLDPEAPCSRSDVVTYLWRFSGKPSTGSASFTDVPSSAAYYQAVAWAVDQGITKGTGGGKFSPDKTCNRAEIVTFLNRAFVR